ncbi:sodium-dependent phosphate transport protein 1, chloroplastic isoform X2 [Diospyros lotus]|uniref:sodium-dependent phosphate transport protein 1, chloroplastic isoform X2 n=2 Tax=Diospyros lotus TaxID=55363 RepID=UPI0022523FBF|nr:sodium-dependent phosphate transport protein 1, chloroplastic isoform X2 [Diospyros lotus]
MRALLISLPSDFRSVPKQNLSIHSKFLCSKAPEFQFRFLSAGRTGIGSVAVRRRGVGKVWAEVKSEPYDVADSKSVKLEDALGSVVFRQDGDDGDVVDGLDGVAVPWWEEFPKRWVIVILCFSAFLLCNMDRVNMSIAILPMSQEFNWNPATVGLIQSSFFWGYLLTQVAGGIWADTVGGKAVLGFGVVWWSIATALTPFAARVGLPFLLVVRAFMGIGEGVAMPAMNNLLSKWVPVGERSRSLAFVYSGMYLGSVTGLAFSPLLIHKFGWASVFYTFGSLGTVWFAVWLNKAHSSPLEDPQLRSAEKKLILSSSSISKEPVKSIPWRLILSKPPVWALIVSHFCHNWGTFILLTWMPTYYNQVLKFNLTESGLFCVLPWLTMAFSANLGGWIADTLVSRGLSVTTVRKIMQSIGFLGPAFFLTQLSHVDSPAMAVLCMSCSQGTDAFSQSGLYSNHQDIAPRYSGVLLGLSNTAGVLAGVFGTAATGYILQHGSWDDVFKVSVGLYLVGTVVWNLFSTGEKILD